MKIGEQIIRDVSIIKTHLLYDIIKSAGKTTISMVGWGLEINGWTRFSMLNKIN